MALDSTFTNGVIAVKEKQLLGEKLLRFPEMGAGEVLRTLSESGFGGGESDPEAIFAHEERVLDEFIRTYAPSEAEKNFFLAPRDFHNLKALYKAEKLGTAADGMLAPEGMHSLDELKVMLEEGKPPVPSVAEDATAAQIGAAFDRAELSYLFRVCGLKPTLKKLLTARADMTDLLTIFRAETREEAESLFILGSFKKKTLDRIYAEDEEVRLHALDKSPYREFYAACLAADRAMFTDAERMKEEFEIGYFFAKRFALSGREPFLYYVFRRKAEIANVRMILICLSAGVDEKEIRRRLIGVM